MSGLTPRYEAITGASLSGIDGAAGRTYTLVNANFDSVIDFIKGTVSLKQTTDFTISGGVVTFVGTVANTDIISLRYFTTDTVSSIVSGYGYVSTADVYRTSGITSTEISTADVSVQIGRAEANICRLTKNIYWKVAITSQAATSGAASSITKTGAGWTTNEFVDLYAYVYSGVGIGQIRKIVSNTSDTLTVDRVWASNPDNTSIFKIFYVPEGFSPYVSEAYDGNGLSYFYLPYYPVKIVETLAIGYTSPVTVTPSTLFLYEKKGQIRLSPTSQAQTFLNVYPQEVNVSYWYGVDYLPSEIKRLVELQAAFQILGQQMGGTFDDPSTVTLPEMSVSIGQAYINIRSSLETMKEEYMDLLKNIKVWPVFG